MFIVFKFTYQLWHTMTKEDVAVAVEKVTLTEKQYQEIVQEEYPAS